MIKNYIKTAWRNLVKNRFYAVINIMGLSVGIAFALLIAVYAWDELSVNHQLKNAENQYILLSRWKDPNMGNEIGTMRDLSLALKQNFPHLVKNYLRWDGVTSTISKGDKHFREGIQIIDNNVLDMYGFKLLSGDNGTALKDPFSVLITRRAAVKYFGHADVVGQAINIENFSGSRHDFIVSGVLADLPKNSVTQLIDNNFTDFFISSSAARFMGRDVGTYGWTYPIFVSYVELQNGISPQQLDAPIKQLIQTNAPKSVSQNLSVFAMPLNQYYLKANNGLVSKMLYTLGAIALFILLMSVVNFINLCVSRSSTRMREIGVRKALGGLRAQLIRQFLVESVLLVVLATSIALVWYTIFREYFGGVVGSEIPTVLQFPLWFFPVLVVIVFLIGVLAGIYPAFVLSSLKSIDSLKGKLTNFGESIFVRKALVVFQFGTAAVVLISAAIITQQIQLFFSKDLGYDKDYVLYVQTPRDWSAAGVQKMEAVTNHIEQLPQVKSASLSWEIPDGANAGPVSVYRQGADSTQAITATQLTSDGKFAETYNIPMLAGCFFSSQYNVAQANQVVINKTESRALGWENPERAIGQKLRKPGSTDLLEVVGVTADFHFASMQQKLQPITFVNVNDATIYRYISIKLKPGDLEKNVSVLKQRWAELLPGAAFDYGFIDAALEKLYRSEIQLKNASIIATALAVIIALLGVVGLIWQSIQKRAKEIGIRKVLGSSVPGIITLFISEFFMVMLVAIVIACPLAYLLMQRWLDDYVYRISITAKPFVLSAALLSLVTTMLIVLLTLKAAIANPVKSLRSE